MFAIKDKIQEKKCKIFQQFCELYLQQKKYNYLYQV